MFLNEKMSSPIRLSVESPVQRRSASVSMTRSHLSLPLTAAGLTSFSASTSTTPNTPTHLMHPALALLKVRDAADAATPVGRLRFSFSYFRRFRSPELKDLRFLRRGLILLLFITKRPVTLEREMTVSFAYFMLFMQILCKFMQICPFD
jgi:hypothetical protein